MQEIKGIIFTGISNYNSDINSETMTGGQIVGLLEEIVKAIESSNLLTEPIPVKVSPREMIKMHERMNTLEQENKREKSKVIDCDNRNIDLQHCISDQFRKIISLTVKLQKSKEWQTKHKNRISELENMVEQSETCCDTCDFHTHTYLCQNEASEHYESSTSPENTCSHYTKDTEQPDTTAACIDCKKITPRGHWFSGTCNNHLSIQYSNHVKDKSGFKCFQAKE